MSNLFVIAFVGRQGSSYLEGLINRHPDAQCLGEILTPKIIPNGVELFLRERVQSSGKLASGFKLSLYHSIDHPEVIPIIKKHNYKCIVLTRENKLDQYISMKLASVNNSWRSDYGEYKKNSIEINEEEFIRAVNDFYLADDKVIKMVQGMDALHMTYEELVAENGYKLALEFLELRNIDLTSPFKRQRKGSQMEVVENYRYLFNKFLGTELEKFFLDRG